MSDGELVPDPVDDAACLALALVRAAEPTLHALVAGSIPTNSRLVTALGQLLERAGRLLARVEEWT